MKYETPEMEVVVFEVEEIVTTSTCPSETDCGGFSLEG